MRRTCLESIYALAQSDSRVVFVGSDLGAGTLDEMRRTLPDRFLMEGVSEAHLVGMCAGLAMEGFVPYLNTIASFLTRRCTEQLMLNLALESLPVRLVGNGGGLVYAPLGPTHQATNDLALLRSIPGFRIFCPADAEEMARLIPASVDLPGPSYIRLARGGDPVVSQAKHFDVSRAQPYRDGSDALIVTTGTALGWALAAAGRLEEKGVSVGVLHYLTVKPFDRESLIDRARRVRAVVVAEEHSLVGGLGSAAAEAMAEADLPRMPRFRRLALPDAFADDYGNQAHLLERYGLGPGPLESLVTSLLETSMRPHGRVA